MKNKENYKEDILEIVCKGKDVALRKNGEMASCDEIGCSDCEFYKADGNCLDAFIEWCDKEYIEPCEFEGDELVEVSENEVDWSLRYFACKSGNKFLCYIDGKKSTEIGFTFP